MERVQRGIDDWNRELRKNVDNHSLISELKRGAEQAKNGAVGTQTKWRHDILWNTYKAAMARDGDFDSSGECGQIRMNKALVNPILNAISAHYEQIFGELLIPSLKETGLNGVKWGLIHGVKSQLIDWEEHEEQEATRQGAAAEGIDTEEAYYILSTTRRFVTSRAISSIQEEVEKCTDMIKRNQMAGWRKIESYIKTSLSNGYSQAANESGSGMFDRMHAIMINEIKKKEAMFNESIQLVINELYDPV